jgi:hypothetical protein
MSPTTPLRNAPAVEPSAEGPVRPEAAIDLTPRRARSVAVDPSAAAGGPVTGRSRADEPTDELSPMSAWWFSPANPVTWSRVRTALATALFLWFLGLAGGAGDVAGVGGWFDSRAFVEAAPVEGRPPIGWSPIHLIPASSWPAALLLVGLVASGSLAIGVACRLSGLLTWLAVTGFVANPILFSGFDSFVTMLSLYLMLGTLLDGALSIRWNNLSSVLGSPDGMVSGPILKRSTDACWTPTVAIRLLQVHLAIGMIASGLHKLQYWEWWSGHAIWFQISPPSPFAFERMMALREAGWSARSGYTLSSLVTYVVLAWQIGFPVAMFRPGARWLWIAVGLTGGLLGLAWQGTFQGGCVAIITSLVFLLPALSERGADRS